jgi:hypothetical protein
MEEIDDDQQAGLQASSTAAAQQAEEVLLDGVTHGGDKGGHGDSFLRARRPV